MKSLGRLYNLDLSEKEQVEQFRNNVAEGLGIIEQSGLPAETVGFAVFVIHIFHIPNSNIHFGENGKIS